MRIMRWTNIVGYVLQCCHIQNLILFCFFFCFADDNDIDVQELISAKLAKKEKWQEGTATVGHNTNANCPSDDRGKSATAREPGCSHDDCTEAKNAARATLRDEVAKGCHAYISSTKPCKNGPGCKK